MTRVLFVCLGNICRSPMAEAIFLHHAHQRGKSHLFEVDSAGILDYHSGSRPDPRTLQVCKQKEVKINHLARQVVPNDFQHYHYILAMDSSNYQQLELMQNQKSFAQLKRMREFESGEGNLMEVPDPYYGQIQDFEEVFRILNDCIGNFLDEIITDS